MADPFVTSIPAARSWLAKHSTQVIWSVIGLAIGGALGWWAGSATACAATECRVRVDAIEAVGTWVGGLGTIAAVLAAVAAFRSEDRARSRAEAASAAERRRRHEAVAAVAKMVTVRWSYDWGGIPKVVTAVQCRVINDAPESTAFTVEASHSEWGQLTWPVRSGRAQKVHSISPGGGAMLFPSDDVLGRLLHVEPALLDTFPTTEQSTAHTTISYTMEGVRWERQGDADPQTVDTAE